MRRATHIGRRAIPPRLERRVAGCLSAATVWLATAAGIASATPRERAPEITTIAPAHAAASPPAALHSTPSAAAAANAPAAPVVKYRVSTSPDEPGTVPNASGVGIAPATSLPGQPVPVHAQRLPLTRAATRQRVESMSPTHWLMHYGDVRVRDRD